MAIFCMASTFAWSQNGLNSPFSQYGIGLNNAPFNMPAFSAIGGVTTTRAASNIINPFNPASYAAIGKETFVFDRGMNIEMSTLSDKNDYLYDADGNLGYLAFGFPVTKWWKTGFGIMPMSDVNYSSIQTVSNETLGETKTAYEGTGGVTEFFWGSGFNIIGGDNPDKAQLRAGFNLDFIYGNLTRAITYTFPGNDTTYFMTSRKQKDTYISNLIIDMGMQYEMPLGDKYRMSAAMTVTPHRLMTVEDNALVYTYVTYSAVEYMRDTIFPQSGNDSRFYSDLEQPLTLGFGLSMQRNDRWLVAVDAVLAPWSGLKYTENSSRSIFGDSPLRYDNNYRLGLGLQLLGNKNSASYMRRITYSAGAHYESGRLQTQINNRDYQLNEWGIAVGASLPMRKGRSVLNLSAAYSSFGDINLLRRNAFIIGISLGSCESWFVKRKFN